MRPTTYQACILQVAVMLKNSFGLPRGKVPKHELTVAWFFPFNAVAVESLKAISMSALLGPGRAQ